VSTHPRFISAFLKSLGSTADEVATLLRKEGIKGIPIAAGSCPIARLVKKRYPKAADFTISRGRFSVGTGRTCRYADVDWSSGVSRFIEKFDGHAYPDLEDK